MVHKTILRQLLEIELTNFATKLQLIDDKPRTIPYDLIVKSLGILKTITNEEESDFQRQLAIAIIALLWTHSAKYYRDILRQTITPILASIGFSPSNQMLDESLRTEGTYSPIGSYLDKLKIIASELQNQVIVYGKPYTLTAFQTDLWKAIDESSLLGVSAPTSAGKSFLIYLKVLDLLSQGCSRFVYVVPTLSLINQVSSDISKLLRRHNIDPIQVLNSFDEKLDRFIYVITQERAIAMLSSGKLSNLDLLIVDEVQNLERVANEGEDRSKILYDVLIDVRNDVSVKKIILSGPRLKNIGNLGFRIFGDLSSEKTTEAPPVLSLTYSISKVGYKYYLNQYTPIFESPFQLVIKNDAHIHGLNQSLYNDAFNEYLHRTLSCLNDDVNVVFSPTSGQARKSAKAYAKFKSPSHEESLRSIGAYFRESVHPRYELASIVESGVAYHTGKTPMHVRMTIEHATAKKLITTLFCTTTLMQGINLPTNNVIVRNPYLFTRRRGCDSASLSPYEFANLRGRAGRLLIDFIGRTIVLDEGAFFHEDDEGESSPLFPDEYKEIRTGYQDIYDRNFDFVNHALSSEEVIDSPAKGLVTYIRQTIYRHGIAGIERLKDVGLTIDDTLIHKVLFDLERLNIDRDVVLANRYWDPVDLDWMYKIFLESNLPFPTNVFSSNLCQALLDWMDVLSTNFPFYFKKYLGNINQDTYLYAIAKGAESWCREKPLSVILNDRFSTNEDNIDDKIDAEIEKLTKRVSYGLPMLLKPIADMANGNSGIISAIELGMHTPIAKFLSDRGVPRETAIKVSAINSGHSGVSSASDLDSRFIMSKLNFWERQHIAHVL